MGKLAFIFPGQGSQYVGMGKDFYEAYTVSANIFDRADKIRSVTPIVFDGTEEELRQTYNSQPAIVVTTIAMLEAFRSLCDIKPDYVLGHSLGEYCALYAANVIDFEQTVKLISKRAEAMESVAQSISGSMLAVLGLRADKISEYVKDISGIFVGNYNSPEQTVVTGLISSMGEAAETLKSIGAKRVIPLSVSGPFHSPYMKNASDIFSNYLKDFEFKNATCPVVTNVDAVDTIDGASLKHKLPFQIHTSVYWYQSVQRLIALGVDTFVEIGPGKVLSGLNKRINPNITTYNVNSVETLKETVESLKARV